MNKKILAVISAVVIIILAAAAGFYLKSKKSAVALQAPVPTLTPAVVEEQSTWNDQSQFSINYPKSLTINPHDEDTVNYAHVELTSATHSGNLIVWARDTSAQTADDWVKKQKIENAIDSTLGGDPAKKIISSGTGSAKLMIAAVHGGYLYEIEANLIDRAYWQNVYDSVSKSFTFTQAPTAAPDSSSASDTGGDTSDGEEVIQ